MAYLGIHTISRPLSEECKDSATCDARHWPRPHPRKKDNSNSFADDDRSRRRLFLATSTQPAKLLRFGPSRSGHSSTPWRLGQHMSTQVNVHDDTGRNLPVLDDAIGMFWPLWRVGWGG